MAEQLAAFESATQVALDMLCDDCPLRNLCGQVEMARLESELAHADDAADAEAKDYEGQLAAIEGDAAGNIVIAAIYKSRKGCEGPEDHRCDECSNRICPAFGAVVDLINEE